MAESQQDIDALLAEVNALADEAVADIGGDPGDGGMDPATILSPEPARTPEPTRPPPRVASRPAPPPDPALARILKLEVPVIVLLAENQMPLSEIMNLSTGAIIEFDKSFDSELDLMANNMCIGRGTAVKVSENFGLRITHIGSLRDRIQALGRS
jgi:flagellar motor switch protein FliN